MDMDSRYIKSPGRLFSVRELAGGIEIYVMYCSDDRGEWVGGNYYVVMDFGYRGWEFSRSRVVIRFGEMGKVRRIVRELEGGRGEQIYSWEILDKCVRLFRGGNVCQYSGISYMTGARII